MSLDIYSRQRFIINIFRYEMIKNLYNHDITKIYSQSGLGCSLAKKINNDKDESYYKKRVNRIFGTEYAKITNEELREICNLLFFENKENFVDFYNEKTDIDTFKNTFSNEYKEILYKYEYLFLNTINGVGLELIYYI